MTICPRCGRDGLPPHLIVLHERACLEPRTVERLAEIGECVRTEGGCLLWRGNANRRGNHARRRAYVVAAEIAFGPAPAGAPLVLHSCDHPGCIEPEHLRYGTVADNIADMVSRRRQTFNAATIAASQRNIAKARAARAAVRHLEPRAPIPHGTAGGYRRGCRCDDCRSAATIAARKQAIRRRSRLLA